LYRQTSTPIESSKPGYRTPFKKGNAYSDAMKTVVGAMNLFFNRGRILRNEYDFYTEMLSAATTKPYLDFIQVTKTWANRKFGAEGYIGFYTRQMIEISNLRMAQIRAAIQLYHLEKKQWPKGLDDLKPYLSPIPVDPFTNKAFLWSHDSTEKPFAYSVGPDFKDDKAKLKYDPTNGTTSAGDIVP
jgi:hypothetical protein